MKILQIGQTDLRSEVKLEQSTKWEFWEVEQIAEFLVPYNLPKKPARFNFAAVIFTSTVPAESLKMLQKFLQAYRVVILAGVQLPELVARYSAWQVTQEQLPHFVKDIERDFFLSQYGDNAAIESVEVARSFQGDIKYRGRHQLELTGDFGTEFKPIATFKRGFYISEKNGIELWPVFEKSAAIELKFVVRLAHVGDIEIQKTLEFSKAQLDEPLILEGLDGNATATVSIWAKGQGTLVLGNINNRLTRHQYGTLIMGGQRFADHKRQEFFYYFDPGNLKPPLTVYFAGWQPRTGFEGYFMMKRLGHPFILFADPRLEGGSFYLGSAEYEAKIKAVIEESLAKLGFTNKELVLSGISMGTTGAIYYGSKIGARAVIVGKPLINLGTIALNNTLHRANEFDTALDLLLLQQGKNSAKAATEFDQRMLQALKNSQLTAGQVLAAYMREDDYDGTAFHDLVENLQADQVKVIGHGYTGRHNDASNKVIAWFLKQYELLLQEFERKGQDETDQR